MSSNALVCVGGVIGLLVGAYAISSGAHGGSIWPTVVLTAPVSLFCGSLFGDTGTSALFTIIGAGAYYGYIGRALGLRSRTVVLETVCVIHCICGVAILVLIRKNT